MTRAEDQAGDSAGTADPIDRLDPRDFETHLASATLRLLAGQPVRALDASSRCVELTASSPWDDYHQACALSALGRPEEADAVLTRALRLVRDDAYRAIAKTLLGSCRLSGGRLDEAARLFSEASREVPALGAPVAGLAVCERLSGRAEQASRTLARVQQIAPGYRPLRAIRMISPDDAFAASRGILGSLGWSEAEFD